MAAVLALGPVQAHAASLEQMAGQMLMLGFDGDSVAETAPVAKAIGQGRLGGVLYLKYNIASQEAVKAMNKAFLDAGAPLPPLIALDQEGGMIERLTKDVGFTEIPSEEQVANTMSPDKAEDLYADLGQRLHALGFNVDFGPVVDLKINPDNPIIAKYERSFGRDPKKVTQYAKAFVEGLHQGDMLSALKHYPGHGSSRDDSHKGFVDITSTWLPEELDPYRALISDGLADIVMTGHLYHAKYAGGGDAQLPATLSPDWLDGILRGQLGFDGVVVTDDMQMGAITEHFGTENAIVDAVNAGADIILFSNYAGDKRSPEDLRQMIVKHAENDPAFRKKVEESYKRIVALKARLKS